MSLDIRLQPKQSELWNLWDSGDYTRLGFGGARGGSKSGGGRRCMLIRRMTYAHTVGLILMCTHPQVYKSHISKLFEEFPQTRQWYNEQRKEIFIPDNGSRLFFGSAEHEKDMADYYSAEFADVLVDEAQEFSQAELENLGGSNRCTTNDEINPVTLYTFMPGISESGLPPKGLTYLKRVFVDGERREEENRHRWKFLQAFSWDNAKWATKELERDGITEEEFYSWSEDKRRDYFIERTEYGATLAALTNKSLRDAWLFGKWGIFQGQYFPNFSLARHKVDPATIKLQPWNKKWLSCDWGYEHPAVVHLHVKLEDGRIFTYKELWGRQIGETELGHKIGELCEGEKIRDFVMSWDAFGKLNKQTRKPITDMVGEALPDGIPKPVPGDASPGSRISGWRHMYNLLDSGGWIISSECPKLLECLPTLVRDMERSPEDVLKVDYSENYIGDDAADSARYGLQHELAVGTPPASIRIARLVEEAEFKEPHSEMIWRAIWASKEKINYVRFGRQWRGRPH